jgi:hypothetical protein
MNQRQYLVNQLQKLNVFYPMEAFTANEPYEVIPADVRIGLADKNEKLVIVFGNQLR